MLIVKLARSRARQQPLLAIPHVDILHAVEFDGIVHTEVEARVGPVAGACAEPREFLLLVSQTLAELLHEQLRGLQCGGERVECGLCRCGVARGARRGGAGCVRQGACIGQ